MEKSDYFYTVAAYDKWNEDLKMWDVIVTVKQLFLNDGESLELGKARIKNENDFLQEFPPKCNGIEHWLSWKSRNPEPEKK